MFLIWLISLYKYKVYYGRVLTHLEFSLAVLIASSFVAAGIPAFFQCLKQTLHKTSSRVVKERTQLI